MGIHGGAQVLPIDDIVWLTSPANLGKHRDGTIYAY